MIEPKNITTLVQLRQLRRENEQRLSVLKTRIGRNGEVLIDALSPSALLACLKQKIASIMELIKVFKGF